MTRVLLACLLLTACAAKDPAGTLQPDARGITENIRAKSGDSVPFRLKGGSMALDIAGHGPTGCVVALTLEPLGRVLTQTMSVFQSVRLNDLKPGVYTLRTDAADPLCAFTVYARPV